MVVLYWNLKVAALVARLALWMGLQHHLHLLEGMCQIAPVFVWSSGSVTGNLPLPDPLLPRPLRLLRLHHPPRLLRRRHQHLPRLLLHQRRRLCPRRRPRCRPKVHLGMLRVVQPCQRATNSR